MFELCSFYNISEIQIWTMAENKNAEQIKSNELYLLTIIVTILEIVAPAACLAFVLNNSGIFVEYLLDNTKPKVSPCQLSKWFTNFLLTPFRSTFQIPLKESNAGCKTLTYCSPKHIWRDGSILCTLVNIAVPGACKDPRDHWKKPPKHGVQLVMEYLDIEPIFTDQDYKQSILSFQKEKLFGKYLKEVYKIIEKRIEICSNMRFSTDYVARGMGLVIGEQNRKSTFYIYPIPKHNYLPDDLEVSIKGPCGYNGHITIPSILHHRRRWQPATDYTRAMYMSSKLNSISPTIQGTSFLRRLSLEPVSKPIDTNTEIDIHVKISPTRAKVTYTPQKTGVYEIKLVTRECHVVGSPYTVPVELPTSSYISNNSSESEDEHEGKYIRRKKRIISKIVDFMDEKNKNKHIQENDTKHLFTHNQTESNNEETKQTESKVIIDEPNVSQEILYVSEKYLDINEDEKINNIAPDIVVTFNKSEEKFVSSTENVNDIQIFHTSESTLVDPTLLKVHDPAFDFPTNISEYRKTFSKKDPSKDLPTPEITNDIVDKTYFVNHLVKVFDSQNIEENKDFSECYNPDLVTCHIKLDNNSFIEEENNKLRNIGPLSEDYDTHQCYLKDCFKENYEQFIQNTKPEEIEKQSEILGIVNKQKQFWDEKLNNSNRKIVETEPENKQNTIQNYEPFEGIVGNKIKIFENNLISSNSPTSNETIFELLKIRKSKSESFLQTAKKDELYEKQKAVSNEEIIKIPTIEERKNKFLQACQQLHSLEVNSIEKCNHPSTLKHELDEDKNTFLNDEETSKISRNQSFGRKARFKQAKQFFHELEESHPNLNCIELPEKERNNNITRSESDTCVSYHIKSYKISDRFPVDDLYQDILGDDKRFLGIPNKMAVVASLASLDSDSSKAEYSDIEGEEPDFDYFKQKPKTVKRRQKNIPGFYGEYPYLPTTNSWGFKTRKPENADILIPGRKLLKTKSTDLSNIL